MMRRMLTPPSAIEALLFAFAEKASRRLQTDLSAIRTDLREEAVLEEFGVKVRGRRFTPQR